MAAKSGRDASFRHTLHTSVISCGAAKSLRFDTPERRLLLGFQENAQLQVVRLSIQQARSGTLGMCLTAPRRRNTSYLLKASRLGTSKPRIRQMYERFTDRAGKIMELANQEAQRLGHQFICTEHILLGLFSTVFQHVFVLFRSLRACAIVRILKRFQNPSRTH
jgi:ATP-dependent Clp protease ATP-binding subunit ClpA